MTENPESVVAMLAGGARRATDGQLVLALAGGVLGALAIILWALAWWRWSLPLICVACFGGWGICDRIVREGAAGEGPFAARRVFLAARWVTAAIGCTALAAAGLAFMAQVLGLMKS